MRYEKELDALTAEIHRLGDHFADVVNHGDDDTSAAEACRAQIAAVAARRDMLRNLGGPALDAADAEIREAATICDRVYKRSVDSVTLSLWLATALGGASLAALAATVFLAHPVWPVLLVCAVVLLGVAGWRIHDFIRLARVYFQAENASEAAQKRRSEIIARIEEGMTAAAESGRI
ncbi:MULTISPECIES: hypothetical protein [Amycolatopsis]|uniref:Uncharacterized protein n=1 Tax=Amycolatopsis saalfeldensis TaxID=394193 RepID=A0A1H8YND0_9PSEU|nr:MULTISPECIES: hypothetical protein [Amycolatopsis]SEP53690.1 hypothetical protein SAMN04489732_129136 [Amycolatopsis saalfeldensis]